MESPGADVSHPFCCQPVHARGSRSLDCRHIFAKVSALAHLRVCVPSSTDVKEPLPGKCVFAILESTRYTHTRVCVRTHVNTRTRTRTHICIHFICTYIKRRILSINFCCENPLLCKLVPAKRVYLPSWILAGKYSAISFLELSI